LSATGNALAGELKKLLAPMGFKRQRGRFSRVRDGYTEHFQIQGSQWNRSGEPWRFYFEVAVQFDDVPVRPNSKGLWAHAHAVGRVDEIASSAPESFEVTEESACAVAAQLAGIVTEVIPLLPKELPDLRVRAELGLSSVIPLPDSRRE
jgi:hypothetical protein